MGEKLHPRNIARVVNSSLRWVGKVPERWFLSEVGDALLREEISESKAESLSSQVKDPKVMQHMVDIFHCTVTSRAISYPVSAALGWYGAVSDRPELVAYALITHIPFIPKLSIAGAQRFLYLGSRIAHDWMTEKDRSKLPHPLTEALALAAAPFTPFGNFSAPARARTVAGEVATFATKALSRKAAEGFLPVPGPGRYDWIITPG